MNKQQDESFLEVLEEKPDYTGQGHASKKNGRWTPRKTGFPLPHDMRREKHIYTDKMIHEALMKAGGLKIRASEILGCDYGTVLARVKADPAFQITIEKAREVRLDRAEAVLDLHLDKNDLTAAIYVTKCLGKTRGYVERMEQQLIQPLIDLDNMTDEQLLNLVDGIDKRLARSSVKTLPEPVK